MVQRALQAIQAIQALTVQLEQQVLMVQQV
jgi:hypothetical protein